MLGRDRFVLVSKNRVARGDEQAGNLRKAIGGSRALWEHYDLGTCSTWFHSTSGDVICEIKDNSVYETQFMNMWYSTQAFFHRSVSGGGLPFHTGLAELNGQGILFAGPGNMGKSTCCRRLPDYWKPLCDDEALVVRDKKKEYRVHPFPTWSDYLWKRAENTWDVHYSVPLGAIFFIEQAETDEAKAVGPGEASILMRESATQVYRKFWRRLDKEDKRRLSLQLFSNACEMAKHIPAFRLSVTLDGKFWEEAEKALGR